MRKMICRKGRNAGNAFWSCTGYPECKGTRAFPAFVLCLLSFVLPLVSLAAPFAEWFSGTSPKGAQVRVWGRGDEYSIRYEAEDGHAVVCDETTQAYFYACRAQDGALVSTGIAVGDETDADRAVLAAIPLHQRDTSAAAREARQMRIAEDDELTGRAARWEQLKAATRKVREAKEKGLLMAPPKRPTIGTARGLTLLVDFPISDSSAKTTWSETHPDVTAEKLDRLLNGDGEMPYGNATSVRGYYKDMSNGRLDYQNVVIGPIKVANPRSSYDAATKSCGTCARSLIGDVLTALKNDANYESKYLPLLKTLDVEAGEVRLLNVWFAGAKAAKWDKGLWAHKSSLDSTAANKLTFTNDRGETVKFGTYQITPVTTSPSIYTFCHENGHMLCNFPDLYSYAKDEDGEDTGGNGIGYYSIMKGSENKTNPIGIDAYLRTAAGWLEPKVLPHGGGTVTVRANGTDVWRYDNPDDPNQYYLIENRQQKGHDESIRGSGILIWRCDEAGSNTYPTELTGFDDDVHRWSYELSLEQADGDYDLETDMVYTDGDGDKWDPWYAANKYSDGDFNDDSLPCARWRDASASGLALSDFSANGDTMTFTVAKYGDCPVNDDFANAIVIDNLGGGEVRSSVGATKEDGEPTHIWSSATKSIWWRLEIPKTAKVTLSTEGSAIDTCLAVYTGTAVDALTKVVSNDDATSDDRYSQVTFDAVGGDIYYVAVAGYSGAEGDIAFNWMMEVEQSLPDLTFYHDSKTWKTGVYVSKEQTTDSAAYPETEFTQGDPLYYSVNMINDGSGPLATAIKISVSLCNESGEVIASDTLTRSSTLSAGYYTSWKNRTKFNGLHLDPGNYRIVCELDSTKACREETKANNVEEYSFTVKAGDFPDLKPPSGYTYPIFVGNSESASAMTEIAYGDPIYYTYRVKNGGSADVSDTEVTMKHCLYDEDGTLVKSVQTSYTSFPVGTVWIWSKNASFNGLNLHAGKYRIVFTVDSEDVVYEQDESNNEAEFEFNVVGGPTVTDGADNADLEFTSGGDDAWFGCATTSHDGTDCLRSGYLGNYESAWLQTTVSGAGEISFWWKVSSEKSYDYLEFYIDGTRQTRISGTDGDWARLTYKLSGGEHELKWNYVKDKSTAKGDDCGYVDQIVWAPAGPKVVPVADLDEPISGVEPEDIKIVSESGVDITAAFTLTGSAAEGVTVTLNPKGAVTIGEGAAAETITVVPQLTEGGDKAVEPFEVKADEVDIGVKTIPGLDYKLNRSTDVSKIREGETVDEKRATSTRTQLRDQMKGGKPEKAFYVIEVGK